MIRETMSEAPRMTYNSGFPTPVMSIKSDKWIRRMVAEQDMIEPFESGQVRHDGDRKLISYGTSSYGYDVRCSNEVLPFWFREERRSTVGTVLEIELRAVDDHRTQYYAIYSFQFDDWTHTRDSKIPKSHTLRPGDQATVKYSPDSFPPSSSIDPYHFG